MQVELSKRDIGVLVVALSRYIRRHELFENKNKMTMQEIALRMRDLSEAADLEIRLDELFKIKEANDV